MNHSVYAYEEYALSIILFLIIFGWFTLRPKEMKGDI